MFTKKIILHLFVCFTSLNVSYAQDIVSMKDIPVVYNIDSLVEKIPSFQNKSTQYITHLITIEESRILFGSYKQGYYLNEIDSLSNLLHYPFGQAFYAYGSAILFNYYSPENTQRPIKFAEKALSLFTSNHDTTGIFLSTLLMAKTYHGYFRYLDNNSLKSKSKLTRDSIQKTFNKTILHYLDNANDLATKSQNPTFKIHLYYNLADLQGDMSLNKEEIKKTLRDGISLIKMHPENNYWLIAFYNLMGNTLVDQDSIQEAITYHSKAIQCGAHKESDFNYVLYNNIGSDYEDLKKTEVAIYYFKKSLEELAKNNDGDPRMEILIHNQISENLEKLNNIHDALLHKKIACELLQNTNDKSLMNAFNLQKNNEILKAKEIKEKTLELKNKNAELIILIGAGLLIIFGLAFFLIYYSRKKLNKAYQQIQELQTSRENFYSIVAHDLRSHIDSYQDMAGMVSYLVKVKKYTQIEKIALQIDKTGLLLKNLLQNLFQWSLSQRQHLAFNQETVNINGSIQQTLLIYSPIAEAKNVRLNLDIKEEILLTTDKNFFETILRNLVDNAIKNSNYDDDILITANVEYENLKLSVQNHSTISDEKYNTIKNLFSSKNEWQVGEQGMGLGLILIKEFTKKMGGQIEVRKMEELISFKLSLPDSN